jgi:hypothetical protein
MRLYAGTLLVFAAALAGWPAGAQERPSDPQAVRRTQSVAVFPDVTPGPPPEARFQDVKPAAPPDPSLELLATNPYEAQLAAALAAQNLYGDELKNPYIDELRFANPYTDELRLQNPYARRPSLATGVGLMNPYPTMPQQGPSSRPSSSNVDLRNPYRQPAELRNPYEPETPAPIAPRAAPARPGTLFIDAGAGFYGSVFVDGVGVMRGVGLPVLPGPHTVTVYPANGAPFSVFVDVPQGASRHVRVGP